MIIDLNLQGKMILVIGGGNEALKRVNSLMGQNCNVIVIGKKINSDIKKMSKEKKIKLKNQNIQNTKFLDELKPYMVIVATDDNSLNQKIIKAAKKRKIIAYSSDNPDESDFANPSIINFENAIKIAIFTGGKSPAMSKKLREKSEKIFKKIITKEDINQIQIQEKIRKMAKENIAVQSERAKLIRCIMNDSKIEQLIKDGDLKNAEKHATAILRNWK